LLLEFLRSIAGLFGKRGKELAADLVAALTQPAKRQLGQARGSEYNGADVLDGHHAHRWLRSSADTILDNRCTYFAVTTQHACH
jgi:hypothetical protein